MLTYNNEEQRSQHMSFFKGERAPLSDESIIDLFWQRNEMAIDETDLKYRHYLMTVAYNILSDSEDCEECLNDTYLGAWNTIPPERPNVFKAFLTVIIRRSAINKYNFRSAQKRVPSELTSSLDELISEPSDSPANDDESRELGRIISDYIRSLTKRRRYIFMSRYYIAEPIDTIAEELGVSRSTVNKDIEAIKQGLLKALKDEGYSI